MSYARKWFSCIFAVIFAITYNSVVFGGPTNYPNGVSSYGLPILPHYSASMTTGNIYFVDSGHSTRKDAADHGAEDKPFATLDYAISRCTANNGDMIFIAPGHAEDIVSAADINLNIAGVTIVGMGVGRNRPTFTWTTAATADLEIDAANIRIINVIFDLTSLDEIAAAIDVDAAGFELIGSEILLADSGAQATIAITVDENGDRLKIQDCEFTGTNNAGISEVIKFTATAGAGADDITITNTSIIANASVANIWSNKTHNNVLIDNCKLTNYDNTDSGEFAIEFTAAAKGIIRNSTIVTDTMDNSIDQGSMAVDSTNWQDLDHPQDSVAIPYTAFTLDGTAVTPSVIANKQGDIYGRLEDLRARADIYQGMIFRGSCASGMVASTTSIDTDQLVGFGNDFFNTGWVLYVDKNASAVGTAPEGEFRDITDYVNGTGVFTTAAFSANVEESDDVYVIKAELAYQAGGATTVAADADLTGVVPDQSVLSHIMTAGADTSDYAASTDSLEAISDKIGTADGTTTESLNGKIGTDTELADNSLYDLLGGAGLKTDPLHDILMGTPGITTWPAAAKAADTVSLAEALRYIDGILSNGTPATITAPAANLTVLDILGSDGSTTTGAAAGSLLGAVGTNEAAVDTPFTSGAVEDDGDGSALERLEHVQSDTDKIDAVALGHAAAPADSLAAALMGANGIAAWPGEAVPGAGVSLVEVVQSVSGDTQAIADATLPVNPTAGSLARFIASGGTALGTQLADSKSLPDALGTNGTTPVDDAASVMGIIGYNDNDNAYASGNVVGDENGSVLERLEHIQEAVQVGNGTNLGAGQSLADAIGHNGTGFLTGGLGYWTPRTATRTTTDFSAAAPFEKNLFTVAGGPIKVISLIGIVTDAMGAANLTLAIEGVATTPGVEVAIASGLIVNGDAAGTIYSLNAAFGGALVENTNGVHIDPDTEFVQPAGTIDLDASVASGDAGDSITWYLKYIPLVTGVTVTTP